MTSSSRRPAIVLLTGAALVLSAGSLAAPPATATAESAKQSRPYVSAANIELELLGRFQGSGAEIAAHDPSRQRVWVTDAVNIALQVLDVSDPTTPALVRDVILAPYGEEVTSVDIHGDLVAAVVKRGNADRGRLVLLNPGGAVTDVVKTGWAPDMVTFTPNGRTVLVANEGEPEGYLDGQVDGPGSVSVVDVRGGAGSVTQEKVRDAGFTAYDGKVLDPSVRITGPNASVSEDLEPEYISVARGSRTAYVTLQENNAVATLDVRRARITDVAGLGYADHSLPGNGIDPSDRDGGVNIAPWPVRGMYMPDALGTYAVRGKDYYVTANEGDGREYEGYEDEVRVTDLDPESPLAGDADLGRLTVTNAAPYVEGGPYYSFGSRSFSIRSANGRLVWDSGDALEQLTAARTPTLFNSDQGEADSFDTRSDNKGPEPEGLVLGKAYGRWLAFVGLERPGGVVVYDITNPRSPRFLDYLNTGIDTGPEGFVFVPAHQSPTGRPMLAVAHEVSATTAFFDITSGRQKVSAGYQVAVLGDTPYGASQRLQFPALVDDINADRSVELVLHAGDVKDGSSTCDDARFADLAALYDTFRDPFVLTPGDNEWTDCHRTAAGQYVPTERLEAVRRTFFPVPGRTAGGRPMRVRTQADDPRHAAYVENVAFQRHDVVFATVHVVGSENDLKPWSELPGGDLPAERLAEYEARLAADLAWIDRAFDRAERTHAKGVLLMMQAEPLATPGFQAVRDRILAWSADFGKPVLLVHGDEHAYEVEPAYGGVANLTRLETFGDTATSWLRLTVDPKTPAVFSWTAETV